MVFLLLLFLDLVFNLLPTSFSYFIFFLFLFRFHFYLVSFNVAFVNFPSHFIPVNIFFLVVFSFIFFFISFLRLVCDSTESRFNFFFLADEKQNAKITNEKRWGKFCNLQLYIINSTLSFTFLLFDRSKCRQLLFSSFYLVWRWFNAQNLFYQNKKTNRNSNNKTKKMEQEKTNSWESKKIENEERSKINWNKNVSQMRLISLVSLACILWIAIIRNKNRIFFFTLRWWSYLLASDENPKPTKKTKRKKNLSMINLLQTKKDVSEIFLFFRSFLSRCKNVRNSFVFHYRQCWCNKYKNQHQQEHNRCFHCQTIRDRI